MQWNFSRGIELKQGSENASNVIPNVVKNFTCERDQAQRSGVDACVVPLRKTSVPWRRCDDSLAQHTHSLPRDGEAMACEPATAIQRCSCEGCRWHFQVQTDAGQGSAPKSEAARIQSGERWGGRWCSLLRWWRLDSRREDGQAGPHFVIHCSGDIGTRWHAWRDQLRTDQRWET